MREKWEKASGLIIESPDAPAGATGVTMVGANTEHSYLVEVAKPGGHAVRATTMMVSRFVHAVGEPIMVEINSKTGEVRVDVHAMAELALQRSRERRDPAARETMLARLRQASANPSPQPASHEAFASPGAFAAPGAFDASGGSGTVQQRLAKLQQLLDKGIVTESEFQAQRQQIIGGI